MSFRIGDLVEAFGLIGKVEEVDNLQTCPVRVYFGDEAMRIRFYSDGRYSNWHKTPSLKLIERPKKTKVFKEWIGNDGTVVGWLIDNDFKDITGDCYKDYFLMWTGREFELEVEG